MNLHFDNIGKSYQGKTVLANISGKINPGDKIGLIGVNGRGKTTLAKLLAGLEACDTGKVKVSPSQGKILYIEQYPNFEEQVTVYEEIFRLALENQHQDSETTTKRALRMVGLDEKIWGQRAVNLSGGEKTKLALCRALVSHFDLLILDEPTNHLDLPSYTWLEDFVQKLNQPLLVISHDRFFLDRVVNKIWELSDQGLKAYEGNYSAYKGQKEIEQTTITRNYEKQQAKIKSLQQMIHERENWFRSAHKAAGQNDFYRSKAKKHTSVLKAKARELARLEQNKIEKPKKAVSPAFEIINKSITNQKFPPYLIQGKQITKAYGERTVLREISFDIKRQDRIALIGPNGAGKTSLLKIICGLEQDYSGSLTVNPSVKIGYFAQELDHLNGESTILDEVLLEGTTTEEARLLLACLLFRGDAVYKKIAHLSMGERGRVAFAKLILSGANVLVLDEPTNYMDILSKEKVEEVLEEFSGVIIFVSHDRYFIQRLANRIFLLENQGLSCYDGGYEYYLTKCREQRKQAEVGLDYGQIADTIRRLECELAFLGGKLNEPLEPAEKESLNERFLAIAKELRNNRELLKGQK